jgi:hypothetical protein
MRYVRTAVWVTSMLWAATAAAASPSPEQLIGRHLAWLDECRNYRAHVMVTDGENTMTGTLYVDTRTNQNVLMIRNEKFPENLHIKATRTGGGRTRLAYSLGMGRDDDLPFQERTMAYTPFGSGLYDLFVHGQGVEETKARLRSVCSTEEVLASSELGTHGLQLTLKTTVMDRLATMADTMLAGDDAPPVHCPDLLTLWFNDEGRLDGVQVDNSDGSLHLEVRLTYDAFNLPADEMRDILALGMSHGGGGAGMAGGAGPAGLIDRVAQAVLPSRFLLVLTVIMAAVSVAVVVRIKQMPLE